MMAGPGDERAILWMIGFIMAVAIGGFIWTVLTKDREEK